MPIFRPSSPIVIEPLEKGRHDRTGFDCGVPALNIYLQRQAAQDMERRAAVVYVAVIAPPTLVGYYTLSQFSIELAGLSGELNRRLARYPVVSATLLGRLAVSNAMKGLRIGETLLFDALRRSLEHSVHIASAGVVVDAKDEQAAAFYRRYGFAPILDADHRLFLPMQTIEKIFE